MKTFKSLADVEAADLSPPVRDAVRRVVRGLIEAYAEYGETYDPDDDGYAILVEGGESETEIEAEVGYGLRGALFEGGYREDGCFVTCTLHNNQYGISWIVVDSPALDPAIRARLLEECDAEVPS